MYSVGRINLQLHREARRKEIGTPCDGVLGEHFPYSTEFHVSRSQLHSRV